ncbi:MAG TPA: DUF3311 domain-containing protein [Segeticoccus sp.]|uniref:DUF3311 domain-containing protein n=1 Tax=Segeticoccus sp. TaxID=2706531 RepID=UPI002D80F035|nr:DUF3311 domain-containing protein [Segeticoccus sp.]HET8601349.1 DUF3311 domain-containing protein [Segeticoccus sp.]
MSSNTPPAPRPDDPHPTDSGSRPRIRAVNRVWYVLLLLPFAATLVPPFYARLQPSVGGWPFFYWWQFAWIIITAALLALVYHLTTEHVPRREGPEPVDAVAGDPPQSGGRRGRHRRPRGLGRGATGDGEDEI